MTLVLNSLSLFWAKIKRASNSLVLLAEKNLIDLWNENKGILILLGGIIVAIKFKQILVNFIVNSSKALYTSTQKRSDSLQKTENKDNNQANNLVQQAQQLSNEETQNEDPNWYKNQ